MQVTSHRSTHAPSTCYKSDFFARQFMTLFYKSVADNDITPSCRFSHGMAQICLKNLGTWERLKYAWKILEHEKGSNMLEKSWNMRKAQICLKNLGTWERLKYAWKILEHEKGSNMLEKSWNMRKAQICLKNLGKSIIITRVLKITNVISEMFYVIINKVHHVIKVTRNVCKTLMLPSHTYLNRLWPWTLTYWPDYL